ncbi:siderophore ABC transporter permease CdtC [Actinomadura kijaniata]|uniref:Iron complex transport system permease protein n=1 Tax=Actinomadura namibiensis TaxID=182080 RepID=A0A7W3QRA1_ACTNM|nr:iron ABC transporter permease [Actinomadura namibiensis]MBA8956158.1 iron complex transport system permease protein [Actinomadura namibiensis]
MATKAAAVPARARRSPAPLVSGAAALALFGVAVVHLGLGAAGVGVGDVLNALTGDADEHTRAVLVGSRIPRTLAGLVAGVALGVSGALIQGATRNPLAAPETLGANAGAYLAVTALLFTGAGAGLVGTGAAAFAGALLAVGIVYLLIAGSVATPGKVLLAGATVQLAATSVAEFLQMLDERRTQGVFFWGNGTLLQAGLDRPLMVGAVVAAAVLAAPLLARPLDLMALGDQTAEALGVRVARVRPAALTLAVLLAAAAVTVAGPIGFVGLVAPVAVRLLGVRTHAVLLPLAGLLGAALLLAADAAAQIVRPPSAGYGELPVGVITALVGGPVFILLARRVATGDADTGAAVAAASPGRLRFPAVLGLGLAALAAAILVGLRVGDVGIGWNQLAAVLTGSGDTMAESVVSYRFPRVVVAAVAGACLAVAGVAVQSVVRNPLAEPSLVGVTGGASAGAVLVILAIPAAPAVMLPVAAAAGGALALALVVLIARGGGGLDPTRVVLVGIGMAATTMALTYVMVSSAQMNVASALTWLAGSTYARGFDSLAWLALPVLAAIAVTASARSVDLLELGDDLPRALGLPLGRARLLLLAAGAALAAGTAAAVGAIGFVGLVAPHLARRIAGNGTARVAPMAAVLGAVLVVVADTVGRSLLAPSEIPVGVVTALIGAPYLVWLLRRTPHA